MRIDINDEYRIISDSLNYILQRKRQSRWINEAYHSSLPGLISTLLERDFRREAESLVKALERNKALVNSVQQALAPLYEVDIRPLNRLSNSDTKSRIGNEFLY